MVELPGLRSACRMQSSRHWFTVSWIRPSPNLLCWPRKSITRGPPEERVTGLRPRAALPTTGCNTPVGQNHPQSFRVMQVRGALSCRTRKRVFKA